MAIANGIDSLMVYKKQTAEGTKASASGAQIMRRVSAEFATVTDKFSSNEIRQSQQQADTRLANYRVEGALSGEGSATTFQEFIAAMLRKDFVAGPTTGAEVTIGSTSSGFTDSANQFLVDGFQAGMIVRATGFTVATENNNKNFLVTQATAGLLYLSTFDGSAIGAETAGASITVTATGKRAFVPLTAHTNDFFTVAIEEPNISLYRCFVDQQINKMDVKVPAAGMATIDFEFLGKTEEAPTGSAYFTSPTAQTTTGNFSGATAILSVNGTKSIVCTNMEFSLDGQGATLAVVGSKYVTGISRAKVMGTGTFSVFLEDDTYLEYFRNETEISAAYGMAATSADDSDAMAIAMPRLKITSAEVSDGEESKIVTCNFDMLEYVGTDDQHENTTICIQDTTL